MGGKNDVHGTQRGRGRELRSDEIGTRSTEEGEETRVFMSNVYLFVRGFSMNQTLSQKGRYITSIIGMGGIL